MTNRCTHRAIRSWCDVDGQPVDMWTCVDCGWMFDPRSDTTEHSTNRSADSAESFHKREPLTEEAIAALLSQSAGIDIKLNGGDLLFARAIERAHGIGREE